jgi:hypothetical protein
VLYVATPFTKGNVTNGSPKLYRVTVPDGGGVVVGNDIRGSP